MGYAVVTGVDKKSGAYHAVAVDPEFNVIGDYGYVTAEALVHIVYNGGSAMTPLNFSVDRAGKLVQDCGDFNRFSTRGSAVVLAEIKSKGGRVLGYRLLSCANNAVVNLRLEEILQREKAMGNGEHFLQNGIIRRNTVNCYPMKPFPVLTVDGPSRKAPPKPLGMTPEMEKVFKDAGTFVPKKSKQTPRPPAPMPIGMEFNEKQRDELGKCKKAGVDTRLISHPGLSPAQMRVLWVAKSKGCMSEAFADPKYSTDVMKFYADRLYDKQTVADCGELLAHPELSVDELNELYACICQGVPYSGLIGLSATDIGVKREMEAGQYWGSPDAFDRDYLEKAANVARRIQSGL